MIPAYTVTPFSYDENEITYHPDVSLLDIVLDDFLEIGRLGADIGMAIKPHEVLFANGARFIVHPILFEVDILQGRLNRVNNGLDCIGNYTQLSKTSRKITWVNRPNVASYCLNQDGETLPIYLGDSIFLGASGMADSIEAAFRKRPGSLGYGFALTFHPSLRPFWREISRDLELISPFENLCFDDLHLEEGRKNCALVDAQYLQRSVLRSVHGPDKFDLQYICGNALRIKEVLNFALVNHCIRPGDLDFCDHPPYWDTLAKEHQCYTPER